MDYIFRWLNLRFLSGTQLSLFSSLASQASQLPAPPSMIPDTEPDDRTRSRRAIWPSWPRRLPSASIRSALRPAWQLRNGSGGRRHRSRGACCLRLCKHLTGAATSGPRHLPRRRRHARDVRDERRPQLPGLRSHHGPQRLLPSLHELRHHQRLQLERFRYTWDSATLIQA